MKFIFHTDGDVKPVIPLFIKAGFDAMQPMEAKARMDLREFAPIYGGKITFFGNMDAQVLSSNDWRKSGRKSAANFARAWPPRAIFATPTTRFRRT